MTQVCHSAGCVEVGRVALVDSCTNAAIPGTNNGYVFGGITLVTWDPQTEGGEKTTVKTMCGQVCVRDLQCDQIVGQQVEITLCRPDNELIALLTGEPALLDDGGDTIGYVQTDNSNCAPFVALELFERIPDSECTATDKYRRIIFPKIRITQAAPERQGPIRFLKLTGMTESGLGSGYGMSPYGDSPADFSLIVPDPQKFHWAEVYETTAPSAQCGYVPVGGDCIPPPTALWDTASSPVVGELSFTGSGFLPLTAVGISIDGYPGGPYVFAYNEAFPGAAALNSTNNITIITWNDTLIQFSSPDIEGLLVHNVAALQCGFDVVIENINSQFIFPDAFYVMPVPPIGLTAFSSTGDCNISVDILLNGASLETVGRIDLFVNDVDADPAGPPTNSFSYYRPGSVAETNLGPNATGVSIGSWSQAGINISLDKATYSEDFSAWGIVYAVAYDDTGTVIEVAEFDINQNICCPPVIVSSASSSAPNTAVLNGANFPMASIIAFEDDQLPFPNLYYHYTDPVTEAGVNPGDTFTVTAGQVTLVDADLSGKTITAITVFSRDGNYQCEVDFDDFLISPLTAYTSPASQTLRLTASSGLLGVDRLAMSFSNGSLFASNVGDPNQAATNAGNGITIISWTDTLVEFTSPFIPTGTATSIALEDYDGMGYPVLAEWFNDVIDPVSGFPIFNAMP